MATMHGMEELAKLGLITREAAVKKVIDPNLVDYRVRDGSLIKVYRGVYRFRGVPESWESRAHAATLYGGAGSAISHFAAAYLHGLEGFKKPDTIELLVPINVQIKPPNVRVHRTREPFQIYRCCDEVIPTTSLARTLVDLAPLITELKLEIALNSAWRKQRTMARWLGQYFTTLKRNDWRGLEGLIKMANRLKGGGLDSGLEVTVTRAIEHANLPAPVRGLIIRDDGEHVIKADLAWPDRLVVAHVDGYAYHQPERAMVRDAWQRSQLSLLKWTQIIIMARTIRDGRWLQQLRQALGCY